MISIFHGDDPAASRTAFIQSISELQSPKHIDSKNIELNQINNYLSSGSLFSETKNLIIDNFFSIPKTNLDKLTKLINDNQCDVFIWQDKVLNATQLKVFPKATIKLFKADNQLFTCLNALKPHNLDNFIKLYDKTVEQDMFDLFLYFLKGNIRRQLQTYSKFDEASLKKIYLQIIELEFQYKTGQLPLPKEIALKRVLIYILK